MAVCPVRRCARSARHWTTSFFHALGLGAYVGVDPPQPPAYIGGDLGQHTGTVSNRSTPGSGVRAQSHGAPDYEHGRQPRPGSRVRGSTSRISSSRAARRGETRPERWSWWRDGCLRGLATLPMRPGRRVSGCEDAALDARLSFGGFLWSRRRERLCSVGRPDGRHRPGHPRRPSERSVSSTADARSKATCSKVCASESLTSPSRREWTRWS